MILQHTAHSRKRGGKGGSECVDFADIWVSGSADGITTCEEKERKGVGGWKKKGVNAPDFLFLFLSLSPPFFFGQQLCHYVRGKLGGEKDLTKV